MIKEKIEKLISNYKKVTTEFLNQIAKWEKDQLYAADYRGEKIREIKAQMQANDTEFNNQLKTIITEEQTTITNRTIKKTDDYQGQVNNAIGFINLLGDSITDEKAFELVKPFFGEYSTMKNFHSVLTTRYGKDGLPVTLVSLGLLDQAINNLDNLKKNFGLVFNNGSYSQNSLGFVLNEKALLSDAEAVDIILERADNVISASFEDIQTELHKERMNL